MLCQPDKSNLAYINCKTGRREFTPTDNEQPGPSNVLSISPEHESNSLLRKHRSHSGVQRYLSISATENIDLLPAEKDKQQTAMTMIGAKSSTDIYNASIDNGFHEKQGDKTVNRKDNSQIIQNNNVELERNAMPILSSKSGSPNDDKSARMETDIRSDVEPTGQESYIFNSTERRDTNALRESETIDKLDVNGNFSSINWTANTIYTRNDSDHSETTCDGSDIKDTENTHLISRKQQITNDTSFNVNASVVDSLHAGDSELHEGNSSQNDTNSNTIVISSTQNSCTNLHDKNINGDIYVAGNGKVESNKDTPRVTCKERPEREDSEEEETRCNRKISHSAGSIEVDSRNNDHQETNTNIDSNSVGENIKCTNSYPYDQDHDWHRITNKERDSDLLSVKGQQARISNRLVIIATESCCCIPDDFTRHDTNARATLNETNAILRNELIDSNKHGTNNRQDDILSSVCNKNESSDESKQDMTEIKNYRENYDDRNINRPDCRGLSENETHINAERTNRAHLVESDDRTAEKPNSSIKSYENKIVIPTGNGEESSESDHTDSECETDIETKTNVDEDVADLKILLELTTGRRFSCVEHAITDKINQNNEMVETTSGRPCKDYVQFVREKTMETAKTKKIKKVKPKNTEKKDKLHKQFITHGKAVKTKDSNDAPPHKTKVTTEKKLKPKQGRSTKKKKKTL